MKRFVIAVAVLFCAVGAQAVEVAGTSLEPSVEVAGERLALNGYGIRKKFFFKVYIGSLYTPRPVASTKEALAAGSKLIRMTFLYSKVERQKVVNAFYEGFANNTPDLIGTAEVRQFLSWFTADFFEGDVVDLELAADGTVEARHNERTLGSLKSPELARAIMLIYLGEHPADEDLKSGMLGLS